MIKDMLPVVFLSVLSFCCHSNKGTERHRFDEIALRKFILHSSGMPISAAQIKLDSIMLNAGEDSTLFQQTVTFFETALGLPNSPSRNDELYEILLKAKMNSSWTDSSSKVKIRELLFLIMQNKVGSEGNNFVYQTPAGHRRSMYDLKSKFTLLYFYNPECNACNLMREVLMKSEVVTSKLKSKQLKVVAIYTDKEEKIWREHLPEMPTDWIHGRDEGEYLFKNKVYDLRAIPTVYLLDRDKKVLLKDCGDILKIEKALVNGEQAMVNGQW
jgi:hypothetical protein